MRASRTQLKARLGEYARDVARAYRAEPNVAFAGNGCPAVVNHDEPAAFVADAVTGALGPGSLTDDAVSMASDHMSLFLEARPGCHFFVGGRPRQHPTAALRARTLRRNSRCTRALWSSGSAPGSP